MGSGVSGCFSFSFGDLIDCVTVTKEVFVGDPAVEEVMIVGNWSVVVDNRSVDVEEDGRVIVRRVLDMDAVAAAPVDRTCEELGRTASDFVGDDAFFGVDPAPSSSSRRISSLGICSGAGRRLWRGGDIILGKGDLRKTGCRRWTEG